MWRGNERLAKPGFGISVEAMSTKRLCLIVLALLLAGYGYAQSKKLGVMYIGVWPGEILVIDEASGQIREKIPLKNGAADWIVLSPDKKKFYATTGLMEDLETVDIKSRRVEDAFTLSQGNRKVRLLRNFAVHPDGARAFAYIRVAVKGVDRYTLEKPQLATIDLRQKKITKTLDLPKEYAVFPSGMPGLLLRVSPDGKLLYFFLFRYFRDILIIDIDQFKIVGRVEIARPIYPGMGALSLGQLFQPNEDLAPLTFTFSTTDPTTNQPIMGIARFKLQDSDLDFFETNPYVPLSGFTVSPDNKRAYGVQTGPGISEFYVYDLESRRLLKKQEYQGYPRAALKVSSDGKTIYVYGAGDTIDYFDAETLAFQKTIALPGDSRGELFVLPQ
jgi:DNA-binding beta-propeller fold protein YncE